MSHIDTCWVSQMKESLYIQVITWVNTILNYIGTREFYLVIKVFAWYINPNGVSPPPLKYMHHICIKKIKLQDTYYIYLNGIIET